MLALQLAMVFTAPGTRSEHEKQLFDCSYKHLTENFLLSHVKRLNYTVLPKNEMCGAIVKGFRDETSKYLKDLVDEDKHFKTFADCMVKKLVSFNVSDLYLEKFVYETDRTMSRLRRQKAVSDTNAAIEENIEFTQELCAPEIVFGERFDEYFSDSEDDESPEPATAVQSPVSEEEIEILQEDYCHRKHLVDKGLIDTRIYKIVVNPSNINVKNIDCEKNWIQTNEDFSIGLAAGFIYRLGMITKESKECIIHTARNGNYAETMLRIWMLSEIKITQNQKIDERANYIKRMKNIYADIMKCHEH